MELENDLDKEFLLNDIKNWFDIDDDVHISPVNCKNHPSAKQNSPLYAKASKQILKEIQAGHYVCVFCFFFCFFFFCFFFCGNPLMLSVRWRSYPKKVREKSRKCHNHKPQPFPDPKRKRKPTNLNKHKPNKRTKSTKISSLFPKRGNRITKRTEKHKNQMTHGKPDGDVRLIHDCSRPSGKSVNNYCSSEWKQVLSSW